jgi:hypothetical protein
LWASRYRVNRVTLTARKQIRHLVDPLNAQFSAQGGLIFPVDAEQRTYSQYEFGKSKNGEAAENGNQKEAYKFFAVH